MFPLPAVSTLSLCADYLEFRDALVRPKLPYVKLLGGVEPTTPSRCIQVLCVQCWRNWTIALDFESVEDPEHTGYLVTVNYFELPDVTGFLICLHLGNYRFSCCVYPPG